MAWFDGTFNYTEEELNNEFPLPVTKNLRMSEDRKRLAIINDFEEGSELLDLSDPHADEPIPGNHIFYHTFLGDDSVTAKRMIEVFLSESNEDDPERIALFRKDPDRFFMYSFGYICKSRLGNQEELSSLITKTNTDCKDVFILPLKRYMYKCPVCGHRTLQYRDCYKICVECGWEDEGIDDEEEESFGANGDYTIRQYREKYLKLKAEDPDYSWRGQYHNEQ